MKIINTLFSLAPAPLFLLGGILSLMLNPHAAHSHIPYEMPIMWFIMFLAHLSPWLIWYQQRSYRLAQTLPVKQQ